MIKKILCAVDFSDISEKVVSYSCFFALKTQAKLYMLHVVKPLTWTEEFGVSLDFKEKYEDDLFQLASQKMKKLSKEHFPNSIDVSYKVTKGDIVKEILDFAEEKNIDLIVLGARGEHGIHEFIFGSVTEKIIKLSPKPVFVVK